MVSAVTPPGQLQIRAREMAKKILRQGPLARELAKIALNASRRVDLDSGLLIETLRAGALLQLRGQDRGHDGIPREAQGQVHGK
jgi:enoyl-CoA hydratase/carnithine racemase